ncbi:BTAD domain-containing putative transcriptional regulator [Actinoplanes sp. NBRC 101535]|uniref:AfsR/SARP family transcriptional regulator n=1 Tax=Actinoplanes sp. NBRC 101535 TaxID=3032196 RepID=UPI002556FE16|nr:BTAD domain-containing putative transcriptional regulator [Actinoplanes sp. NBRC 101535]
MTMFRFSLLGPVRAWQGGTEADLGGPQQQVVLAALLLREGTPATVDELIRAVWGEDPPPTAVGTIRTYVSRLRRVLGGAASPIRSLAGGYVLRLPAEAADWTVFRRRVAAAHIARRDGDPRAAYTALVEALDLWQGCPLAGLPGEHVTAHRARLSEARLFALADRISLDLEFGRHAAQTVELALLVAEHPLHERFRELSMLALYGSGRQAEALAGFRDIQRRLRAELGLTPGPGLRALHHRILTADPALLPATPAAPEPVPPVRKPHRAAATDLRFTLLGPLGAVRDGVPLPVGTPQQRALLAALLLRPGAVVAVEELVAVVWGTRAPAGAGAVVRTYVSRLRKTLGAATVTGTSGGYTAAIAPDRIDLGVHRDLVTRAASLRRAGRPAAALPLYGTAGALWRGSEPLGGVPGEFAVAQRGMLRELRFATELDALAAALDAPGHDPAPALARLRSLVARHPMLERPRELLMLALTRSGQPAAALAAFDDGRNLLADRLGVDPGPGLLRIRHTIAAVNRMSTGDRRPAGVLNA